MKIISLNDNDASLFYMGVPCNRGHDGKRYVSSGGCVECISARSARIRADPSIMVMQAISREEAKAARDAAIAAGEKFYVGQPCIHGHCKKYVSNHTCVECTAAWTAKLMADPIKRARKNEVWRLHAAIPEVKAHNKERSRLHNARPEVKRRKAERHRSTTYALTPFEYDCMLAGQQSCCASCGADEPGGKYNKWQVDHCHVTNKVRGLLCSGCNIGIGRLGDNAAGVRRALEYLERFECQTPTNDNSTPPISVTVGQAKVLPFIAPNAKPHTGLLVATSSQNSNAPSRKSA